MSKFIKSTAVLVSICAVMTFLLAVTNEITAPIIAENENSKANSALLEVMPEGGSFELIDVAEVELPATVTEAYRAKNGGHVFKLTTSGYNTGMVLVCGVSADGKITGVKCIADNETPSIGGAAIESYAASMVGQGIDTVDGVDTVTGATMTTKAYRAAVKDALGAAIILCGGEADTRTPEEIFNANLKEALPGADEFVKQAIADENAAIDFIYTAKNGAGFVYVTSEELFVGVDATGIVVTEGVSDADATLSQSKAALAARHIAVDTTDSGINQNITSVQKTPEGNYVIEVNGLGFGWFGDEEKYQKPKNIPIKICVVMTPAGKILKCLTVSHQESGGYGAVCGDESYYGQFDGKTAEDYKDVDIVGSPTYSITNNGYLKAIERCFAAVEILEGRAQS